MYAIKILADSAYKHKNTTHRVTSWLLTYPRIIHSELMTHRVFSRSASSSRAIPVERMIANVLNDPFYPVYWGKNQKGMQAEQELDKATITVATDIWTDALHSTVAHVQELVKNGVHKQVANRLLEPFSWITVVVTATEFANFFALRAHKDAQPEFRVLAEMMKDLYYTNEPEQLDFGYWHLPFVEKRSNTSFLPHNHIDDWGVPDVGYTLENEPNLITSTASCARASYLNFDGGQSFEEDQRLHDRLIGSVPGHWSPLEHQVTPFTGGTNSNLVGFLQYRKLYENECIR